MRSCWQRRYRRPLQQARPQRISRLCAGDHDRFDAQPVRGSASDHEAGPRAAARHCRMRDRGCRTPPRGCSSHRARSSAGWPRCARRCAQAGGKSGAPPRRSGWAAPAPAPAPACGLRQCRWLTGARPCRSPRRRPGGAECARSEPARRSGAAQRRRLRGDAKDASAGESIGETPGTGRCALMTNYQEYGDTARYFVDVRGGHRLWQRSGRRSPGSAHDRPFDVDASVTRGLVTARALSKARRRDFD